MVVWFGVGGVLFYPIAFDVAPRFFLVTTVIPFVLLGLIVQWLMKHKDWGGGWLAIGLILTCFFSSSYYVFDRLNQLSKADMEAVELTGPDRILKERGRVTLEVQQNVSAYIESMYKQNHLPAYIYSEPFYKRSIGYLLDQKNVPHDGLKIGTIYEKGNHFFIIRTQSTFEKKFNKYQDGYEVVESIPFGVMTVYRLKPKLGAVTNISQDLEEFNGYSNAQSDGADHKRYIWREVFESQ
jgi:hypothetical protein